MPGIVSHTEKLGDTLSKFRKERAHMAIVKETVVAVISNVKKSSHVSCNS